MQSPYRYEIRFASWEQLRRSCTFADACAVIEAPWSGAPLTAGLVVRLTLAVGLAPGSQIALESARVGQTVGDRQQFFVHGDIARALAASVGVAPPRKTPAHTSHRAPMRWKCTIPSMLEFAAGGSGSTFPPAHGGASGLARIVDVSDTGVKLETMGEIPPPGTLLRVRVSGNPGDGLTFHGRVVWTDRDTLRAGLRFLPRAREEARQYAAFVSEVVVESLVSSLA